MKFLFDRSRSEKFEFEAFTAKFSRYISSSCIVNSDGLSSTVRWEKNIFFTFEFLKSLLSNIVPLVTESSFIIFAVKSVPFLILIDEKSILLNFEPANMRLSISTFSNFVLEKSLLYNMVLLNVVFFIIESEKSLPR